MVVSTSPSNGDAASHLAALGYNPAHLLTQYREQGYIIISGIIPSSPSSPISLTSLRTSSEIATTLTRSGAYPHRRVVGTPFPPFTSSNPDSWGVQHIMNPALGPISTTFQSFYASSPLLDIASLLLGMEVKDMQMELFNLLINPSSHYFALGWHRDDIKPDVTPEEEEERLRRPTYGVQFNTALYDDDCLFIVPGTHRRVRTKEEARANMAKAPPAVLVTEAEGFDGGWEVDPPNTFRVKLKAGETVFYSQRILHRASYGPKAARATLHGCFGDASEGGEGTKERARNVLQHGVEWMREPSFVEGLEERVKPMWANLMRMDAAYRDKELGYSLDND